MHVATLSVTPLADARTRAGAAWLALYNAAESALFEAALSADEGCIPLTPSAIADAAMAELRASEWPIPIELHAILRAEARWMLGDAVEAVAVVVEDAA